ncbi:hypothetical protein AUP71_03280 [Corynebacterium glutamicum]|uniref:tape measure protein n=1 Tax=Corynebacterium glutamicum TaxID=1718 RepID=UPI000943E8F0|nr:tape measure protein [Corynebacterium glutamicum]OKX95570.1 hypothetical protein AUP71_03280 [Corynebacterium glutamicum]
MSVVGFASIPVIPSLDGITKDIERQLSGPLSAAAKKAGGEFESILANSAEQAAKKVELARKREVAAAAQVEAAERKIMSAKADVEAATKKVETAEKQLDVVRSQQNRKVEDAEKRLKDLRDSGKASAEQVKRAEEDLQITRGKADVAIEKQEASVETARRKVTDQTHKVESAEDDLNAARRKAKDAADNVVSAEKRLQDEQDETGKTTKSLRDRLRELGDEQDSVAEKSRGLGDKLMSGLGKVGTGALLGVGAQIGSTVTEGIETAFSKGFSRLASIEQAQTMLEGLGNSGAQVQSIMDSAMDSVSGTAFGFGEAASMAATFSGAGIKESEELTRILSLVGDTTAITGADFTEMGSIWTKVATSQRISTEEMNQLMDRGLGVLPELQAHYGVTADEARKMVTEGKVSFEDFSEIMENMVGGSAALMGETFSGSAANMQAALGRLGAKLLDPIYSNAPAIFGAIGEGVDRLGEHMAPLIEEFSIRFGPMIEDFASRLGPWLIETIDSTAEKLKESIRWIRENEEGIKTAAVVIGVAVATWKLWSAGIAINNARILIGQKGLLGYIATTKMATAATKLLSLATKANIFGLIVTGIAAAVAGLIWFFTKTETGREMWSKFTTAIVDGWNWTTEKLGAGVQWIQDKFNSFTGWISDAWSGISSLFKGDFTAELRESFDVEEDNPLISGFLKAHEILTGIPKLITGIADILFRGEFSGMPFGLEEDSGLVNFFFKIREAVIKTGEIISAVWDGIVTVGKYAIAIIGTIVITPLILYWNSLSSAVKLGYEKLILPTFNAFATAGKWLWENALKPAFAGISAAWSFLGDALATGWAWIDENVIQAVVAGFEWLGEVVLSVFDFVAEKWQITQELFAAGWAWIDENMIQPFIAGLGWLGDKFAEVIAWIGEQWNLAQMLLAAGWLWIDGNIFQLFRDGAQWVGDKFQQVVDGIGLAWDAAKLMLHAGWLWIDQNVFSIFRLGVELMKSATETAMNGIGTAFDWLREKTASPINFVIREVYMGGIRQAWGAVARLVDVPELPEIQEIGGFAQGTARVPGARTRHDNMHMVSNDGRFGISLRGGEGVVVPEVVDGLGEKTINDLNSVGLRSGAQGVRTYMEHFGGFSNGGIIDSMIGFVSKHFPQLQMTSGWRFTDNGLHSRGQAADFSNQGQGGPSTPESRGLARAIYQNFPNQTEQLIHWKLDGWENLLSGRPFDYGSATNAQHTDHVHWGMLSPLNYDADELDLSGGGSGVFETITAMAKRLWDGFIDKVPSFDGSGIIGDLPEAFLKKTAGTAWDYIKSLADKIMSASFFTGASGAGAEQWRDLARTALARFGYGEEYLDAMVKQIDIESSGDPNAINLWDENATVRGTPSRGLLQVIEPTYRDVRNKFPDAFEGLPDDPTHPLTNLVAGIGALERDWGGPPGGRWPTRDGYHAGGLAGSGQGWLKKTAIEPEFVLAPNETKALMSWLESYRAGATDGLPTIAISAPSWESFQDVMQSASDAAFGLGNSLAGPFLDSTEEVVAALEKLEEARKKAAQGDEKITEAEKALTAAQEELEEALNGTAETSTSNSRKLEDAEEKLAEAREAQAEVANKEHKDEAARAKASASAAEKVADAEKKLARAREDEASQLEKDETKRAESIAKAEEKVAKAEQGIIDARDEAIESAEEVAKAERAVAAARLQALGRVVTATMGSISTLLDGFASLAGAMAEMAAQMTETEDQIRSLRVESAAAEIARLRAAAAMVQAETDLEEARTGGAETTRRIGDTSVEALGKALLKFRETGVLSVEMITEAVNSGTAESSERITETQEDIRQAMIAAEIAALDYLEASINAQHVTEMQRILTAQLMAQQAAMYGLGQSQFTALELLVQGIVSLVGGVAKIAGAVFTVIAAFATGGPAGILAAIAAIPVVLDGVSDIVQGATKVRDNWDEGSQAFNQLAPEAKVEIILGGMASVAPVVAGAAATWATGDVQYLLAGIDAMGKSTEIVATHMEDMVTYKFDRINSKYDEMIEAQKEATQAQLDQIAIFRSALELMASTTDQDILNQIDIDSLLDSVRGISGRDQTAELVEAEREAAVQRESTGAEVVAIREKMDTPTVVNVSIAPGTAYSADEVEAILRDMSSKIDGLQIQFDEQNSTSASVKVNARR